MPQDATVPTQPSAAPPDDARREPAAPGQRGWRGWRGWQCALALLVLGTILVFYRLGEGPIDVYDEGLYGRHARSALEHHVYLHAVDTRGSFPTGEVKFSKPPLSIWVTAASLAWLGPTLFALRLPFALATLASALIAFLWGCRIDRGRTGPWLGFIWGLLFLASHGAYHFGRTATIDALLLAFVMLATYAHARAIESRGWRAVLCCVTAGIGVALAFLTKQLVCAIAVVPIALVELGRMRTEGIWRPLGRMSLSLGVPLLVALGWVAMLWRTLGAATKEVLWSHAIVRRVQGFDGLHHHNYLNRIAEQLDLDAAPFSWPLGLFGLVLLVAERSRSRQGDADTWLLAGTFACSWLAFDVGSRAILPWYAFTLLMPLALGNGLLITRACAYALAPRSTPTPLIGALLAAAGAGAVAYVTADAARTLLPAPLVAAGVSALIAVSALAITDKQLARRTQLTLVVAGGLTLAGVLTRERYAYTESDPAAVLGSKLAALGARRVSIDSRTGMHDYTRVTFYGVKSSTGEAPWSTKKTSKADARIENEVLPRQAQGAPGQKLLRAAGMFAVYGPLTQHPLTRELAEQLLSKAPLTYEAEDLASARYDTLAYRSDASGGAVRRMTSWPRRRPESFKLAHGTLSNLPSGNYSATFDLRTDCGLQRGAKLGEVSISNLGSPIAALGIQCTETQASGPGAAGLTLKFSLLQPGKPSVAVRYDQGTIELDRITLKRE